MLWKSETPVLSRRLKGKMLRFIKIPFKEVFMDSVCMNGKGLSDLVSSYSVLVLFLRM
jgi:hypothetical protein